MHPLRDNARGYASRAATHRRQGRTLVHFSAQPELLLSPKSTETPQRVRERVLTSSRKVDECKPLISGGGGGGRKKAPQPFDDAFAVHYRRKSAVFVGMVDGWAGSEASSLNFCYSVAVHLHSRCILPGLACRSLTLKLRWKEVEFKQGHGRGCGECVWELRYPMITRSG